MSSATGLRPWTDLVRLHPDVDSGSLSEAVFAIDLGAIASGDPAQPVTSRDPHAFLRATYLTADLKRLLGEVLGALAGEGTGSRVLKLRTPFGGGKSHTLATLLHAARSRDALDVLPEAKGLARPEGVRLAVFDGEKFDARDGKPLPNGRTVRTMWGWIAHQIGEDAFALVEGHDRDRVAPGGDVVRQVLTQGAAGKPVLILLDEVLKYMERASAVSVLDSTLQRQAKDFFQTLTVEVAGSERAAMAYSLQWSAREGLGNVALLQELDKLAARVDQLREPVSGDEVLAVLQRRLLGEAPDGAVSRDVAVAYEPLVTGWRRSHAETTAEKQRAEDEGLELRSRMEQAYPFHPALIDVMQERWAAVESFQRTRGALRFLATCLHSLKSRGAARATFGPGDIPIDDPQVRIRLLNELGAQNDYDPVLTADVAGPNSRARRIDERLARESPGLASQKPATRLATAILAYSFGGLRKGDSEEVLPPGVSESELLAATIGPDLDTVTATAVLAELRSTCLYLHHDGVRYSFKKDPNVTKLVEDAEQEVAREETRGNNGGPVRSRIREVLERRLSGHRECIVWPEKSHDVPDLEPRFLLAYLPLDLASSNRAEQERTALELLGRCGDKLRVFRNGLGLVVPRRDRVEAVRRATRYLLAIERVESKKSAHRLTREQEQQLRERRKTEEAALESSFRSLYDAVWLPRLEGGELAIERIEAGGRPLSATGIHERVLELLTAVGTPKLHGNVMPRKIAERVRLADEGMESRRSVSLSEVVESFYRKIEPPRLTYAGVIQAAVAKGVAEKIFALVHGQLGAPDGTGRFPLASTQIRFGVSLDPSEVDLESSHLITPSALPERETVSDGVESAPPASAAPSTSAEPPSSQPASSAPSSVSRVRIAFTASRDQLFGAFPALANLADAAIAGRLRVRVEAESEEGFESEWLRNAVEEPLDEMGVEPESSKE